MSPLLYQLSYTATFRKQGVDYITVVQPETNHSVARSDLIVGGTS